jgi:hypothetical protein
MSYIVTYAGSQPAPAGINRGLSFEQALAEASRLLAERQQDVAIQDGSGRSISGDDLVACCNGDKTLTLDLRAI